jgi:hypothetical protein
LSEAKCGGDIAVRRRTSSFRGAAEGREPGIHNPSAAEYGFQARRFAAFRNDEKFTTAIFAALNAGYVLRKAASIFEAYNGMRRYGVVILALLIAQPDANARDLMRTARSGETKSMARYYSFNREDCSQAGGVVKLIKKPSHGTLITRAIEGPIGANAIGAISHHCVGKAVKSFQVLYKSKPGYHGTDSFKVQLYFGGSGRSRTDTIFVIVK